MSTPPGQEPRPGFTPRAGQARPGPRGDSGWADDASRRGDPGPRKPAPGSSGRAPGGPGGNRRDADQDVDDYWLGGRQGRPRAPSSANGTGSRPQPGFTPARRDPGPRNPAPRNPAPRDQAPRDPATRRPDDRDRGARAPGGPGQGTRNQNGQGTRNQDGRDRDWRNAPDGRTARDGSGASRGPGGRRDDALATGGRTAPAWVTRTPTAKPAPRSGLRAAPALRWVGTWSGRRAVLVLFGAALLGLIGTVVIGHDPGFLIGFFLLIGSVAAAIGAQRRVYQLIPLPALSYFMATTIAGYMHDRSVLNGGKEWVTNFLTWIGSAFLALVWATVLVAVIAVVRWMIDRRAGQPSAAAGGTAGRATMSASARPDPWSGRGPLDRPSRPGGRGPQPGRDARGTDRDSFADRSPGGNAFEADGGNPWGDRGPRDSRDSRDDRDSRGEPGPRRDRDLNQGQRDDRGQDPYSGPRDDRRPPPKTPPRDLW